MIEATRYKNGSIHLHGSIDKDIAECDIVQILWALEWVDCTMIGEEYCRSNYDMGITVYSWYEDKCYDLSYTEIWGTLHNGKVYIIKPRPCTDLDREDIAREYGEDTDTDISTEATNDTNIA